MVRHHLKNAAAFFFLLFFISASFLYAEQITIVGLGDSTTAGTPGFFSPAEAPPEGRGNPQSQYAYWLEQKHPGWKIKNRGIRAQRSDQIMKRIESDVLAFQPQAVVVLAGVVDIFQNRSAEEVQANLAEIYRRLTERGIKIVACTVTPYAGMSPDAQARLDRLNAWIKTYAAQQGFGFCDVFHAVENPARPYTLKGSPDGLHPDVAGYRAMAEVIEPALSGVLKSRR